jgi:hypothetical protein
MKRLSGIEISYLIGALLFLAGAARFLALEDLVGASINSGAAIVALISLWRERTAA